MIWISMQFMHIKYTYGLIIFCQILTLTARPNYVDNTEDIALQDTSSSGKEHKGAASIQTFKTLSFTKNWMNSEILLNPW